ncbi:MAG TPA: type IV toxin-antitoxin system AbiEi family antitoxin [Solirubrobacterales bacterium]|nr:type IV toxin-antitoxin system AbiEi family antitoxin [Solirubrobacterales bacterium]
MAAILACGEGAFLTHLSAGALFGICEERPGRIEVGVPRPHGREPSGIRLRRRPSLPSQDVGALRGIPVTSPVRTMIDLATEQGPKYLLRSINEADKLEVILADDLRVQLDAYVGVPGAKRLVALLDRDTFVLSDEELERLFLPLALEVGLSLPRTKIWLNGFEVDFFWPELRLVVETDGLRYHRTPSAQARDLKRDQAHRGWLHPPALLALAGQVRPRLRQGDPPRHRRQISGRLIRGAPRSGRRVRGRP